MATEIWLVRHGATPWSAEERHAGRCDLPLTDKGRDQARETAPLLAARSFDQVWVSPQERARETCALAGYADLAVVSDALVEWDWGAYEGISDDEIEARQPGFSLFRDGAPDGERPRDVEGRLGPVIDRLGEIDGPVLVFSHGRTIRSFAVLWLGLEHATAELLPLDTASVSMLSGPRGRAQVGFWNALPVSRRGAPS